jgi:Xaa-Pro aminopeptidase
MRYKTIPSSLFVAQKTVCRKMSGNSIAILSSNDVMPNNADDVMGFAQNNDLFYLSGIDQDETVWFFTQMLSKKKTERFLL